MLQEFRSSLHNVCSRPMLSETDVFVVCVLGVGDGYDLRCADGNNINVEVIMMVLCSIVICNVNI